LLEELKGASGVESAKDGTVGTANIRHVSAQQVPKATRGYVIEQVTFQKIVSIGLDQSSFKETKLVVLPFAMKVPLKGDQNGLNGEN
jgi:hypothetical protein